MLVHRLWFYERCETVLDNLDLPSDKRIKIAAMLDARVPRPTATEVAAYKRRLSETPFRPDAFTALMMAWSAASNAERQRFLDEVSERAGRDSWSAGGRGDPNPGPGRHDLAEDPARPRRVCE